MIQLPTYHFPDTISRVICSDMDETFIPFSEANRRKSGISVLEAYLLQNISRHSMIFGLITGSNLDSALRKIKECRTRVPHFIASSLGTELHWFKHGNMYESEEWISRVSSSGYQKENIHVVIEKLSAHGVNLIFQPDDYQGRFKSALYYPIRESIESDFFAIESMALQYCMKVLFSRSNPAAGDPENCYDVEFIPPCCGKGEVVDFLQNSLSILAKDTYCFGDSFNDFPMFSRTENAFLVSNADPGAKKKHPQVLTKAYCFGIKEKLEELFP